jgi:hypothetical protein
MIAASPKSTGCRSTSGSTGCLFLVRGDDLWSRFIAAVQTQRSLGAEVEILEPGDARDLVPGISLDGVVGATYGPRDGIADPWGLTNGYATLARRAGAEVRTSVDVRTVRVVDGRVLGVETDAGTVDAPSSSTPPVRGRARSPRRLAWIFRSSRSRGTSSRRVRSPASPSGGRS